MKNFIFIFILKVVSARKLEFDSTGLILNSDRRLLSEKSGNTFSRGESELWIVNHDMPLEVISSKGPNSDVMDTVQLMDMDVNKIYSTRIKFGNSTHLLMLDTGSSWTWVNSCNSDVHDYWND